jgi:surface-adhesin protein E
MKRLLLAVCLVLNAGPAFGEWELASEIGQRPKAYIDFSSIRRNGQFAKMWDLFDLETSRSVNGKTFQSSKHHKEYGCIEEQSRLIAMTAFSDRMGSGNVVKTFVYQDEWQPVEPGSVDQDLWQIACPKSLRDKLTR